jgi:hypothetical protein
MKKFFLTFLAAAFILPAVFAQTNTLKGALSGAAAQDRDWRFLVSAGGGEWRELYHTAVWGDNWQSSRTPDGDGVYHSLYLSENKVLADIGLVDEEPYAIAAVYTAPKDGNLTIPPWRHLFMADFSDLYWSDSEGWVIKPAAQGEAFAIIKHNDTELYCGVNSPAGITASEELSVTVAAGDTIWFIAEPIDAKGIMFMNDVAVSYSGDALALDPVKLDLPRDFGGEGYYVLRETFMGDKDQGPEWYYMKRYDGGSWAELNYYPSYGDNWQAVPNPQEEAIYYSLFDWNGVGAQTGYDLLEEKPYEIAAVFKAPLDGDYVVPPFRHIMFQSCDFDAGAIVYTPYTEANTFAVELRVNDETKYFQRLSGGYQESPELSFTLKSGDMVYFIFRAMELNDVSAETPSLRLDDVQIGLAGSAFTPWSVWPDVKADQLPVPPTRPGDPGPKLSKGLSVWLYIGIGAGVAVLIAAIILLLRKRKN